MAKVHKAPNVDKIAANTEHGNKGRRPAVLAPDRPCGPALW